MWREKRKDRKRRGARGKSRGVEKEGDPKHHVREGEEGEKGNRRGSLGKEEERIGESGRDRGNGTDKGSKREDREKPRRRGRRYRR